MKALALIIGMALVVASCGGNSGDAGTDNGGSEANAPQAGTTQPPSDDSGTDVTTAPTTAPEADSDGGADSEGSGPSSATVTLGAETYNFSTEGAVVAQCLTDLFGIFSIQLPMVDDGGAAADGNVSIVVLREGTDPEVVGEVNSVQLDVGDETWVADEADDLFDQFDQLQPGMSQVDSVEIDGRTVRGSATFFRQNSLFAGGEVETMTGTFEGTCGEERTS